MVLHWIFSIALLWCCHQNIWMCRSLCYSDSPLSKALWNWLTVWASFCSRGSKITAGSFLTCVYVWVWTPRFTDVLTPSLCVSFSNPSFRAGSVSCCVGRRIPLRKTGRSGRTSPWSAASWASPRSSATPSTSRRAAPGSSTTTSGRRTWCTSPATSYRWAWRATCTARASHYFSNISLKMKFFFWCSSVNKFIIKHKHMTTEFNTTFLELLLFLEKKNLEAQMHKYTHKHIRVLTCDVYHNHRPNPVIHVRAETWLIH